RAEGVEFALSIPFDENVAAQAWGTENAAQMASWARDTWKRLQHIGDKLHAGKLAQVHALGVQRHVGLGAHPQKGVLCIGFRRNVAPGEVEQNLKQLYAKWAS